MASTRLCRLCVLSVLRRWSVSLLLAAFLLVATVGGEMAANDPIDEACIECDGPCKICDAKKAE